MIIKKDEIISKYTTVGIGGIAKKMMFPESPQELLELVLQYGTDRIIGGGSNLLVKEKNYDVVISMKNVNNDIEELGEGIFRVGGSVRLQQLIRTINEAGYGGIEYLYSVPGMLGGAIYMNAGGSISQGWTISDHIKDVKCIVNNEIKTLKRDECKFGHRSSIFKNNNYVIVEATMVFDRGETEKFIKDRNDRLNYCKKNQDTSAPNFGSVFKTFDSYIMEAIRRMAVFKRHGAHYSSKTANWIVNNGNGTFRQVYRRIVLVKILHKILKKECETEVIIWK